MATILMGWELGEGLAHVQRLLRVARPLAEQGHRVVFALANVAEPWPLYQRDAFQVLQAPYWSFRPRHGDRPFLASSFADVLAVRGWESVDTLLPLVEAWQHQLENVRPALVVTEFAPTLCLAALHSVPVIQVGNWFSMPPVHAPTFPVLLAGRLPVVSKMSCWRWPGRFQRVAASRFHRPLPAFSRQVIVFPFSFPNWTLIKPNEPNQSGIRLSRCQPPTTRIWNHGSSPI